MSQSLQAVRDTTSATAVLPLQRIVIAADRCKGCELCIHACAPGVLALDRSRVNALGYNPVRAVAIEHCTSCALCARVCPDCVFTVFAPGKAAR